MRALRALLPAGTLDQGTDESARVDETAATRGDPRGSLLIAIAAAAAFTKQPYLGAVAMVLAVPPVLDLSTRVLKPVEERKAQAFVNEAIARLEQVRPRVVAITGSYGKTSTKHYLAALLSADYAVVASPRSFNNRAGLSRSINESLADGTQVFIAEMGTYGRGEIAAMVVVRAGDSRRHGDWPGAPGAHEDPRRHRSGEARDHCPGLHRRAERRRLATGSLARLAARRGQDGGASRMNSSPADLRVVAAARRWTILADGDELGALDEIVGVQPTNLACAIGSALALGVAKESVLERVRR